MVWIAELRARSERGDLTTLGPIDFDDGLPALPAEHTVLLMLADLDELEAMTPSGSQRPRQRRATNQLAGRLPHPPAPLRLAVVAKLRQRHQTSSELSGSCSISLLLHA